MSMPSIPSPPGVTGLSTGGVGLPHLLFPKLLVLAGRVVYRLWGSLSSHEMTVDGLTWSYLDGGKGDAILFVHGFGADKYRFGHIVPCLSRTHRVIVPDLPGFGESTKEVSLAFDIPSQVQRLARFIDTVGLDRFHLVGLSMGGYISALYTADFPDRVSSLALIDAAGVRSPRPSYMFRLFAEDEKILLLYRNRRQFDELISALFYHPPWIPGPVKEFTVRQALRDFEIRRKVLTDIFEGGTDLLDGRLGDIGAKTLILWGADDKIVDPSSVEVFSRGIKHSQAVVFGNCGHIPIIEKWRESSRVYRDFLSTLDGGRASF